VKTEDDPFDSDPPATVRETLAAIRHVEEAVVGADWTVGIALRYGGFYGPGTSMDLVGGEHVDLIRKRRMPIVGDGGGVWSFIHIADAAEATIAALTHGERGVYNIVDDDPAPVREWLPEMASELGAKPPRHVPRFVGRLLAGEAMAVMMTEIRGASNAKARSLLDWAPAHSSWRGAFAGTAQA
jgi:nucleoside-diphosphate-sugar epimerase